MKVFKEVVDRKVPKKNYYIVLIVSILVIILTLYIRSFYLNYKASEINYSIFYDKAINQINTDDINFAFDETSEAILYVSYNGSNRIRNMERKLFKVLEERNIIDKFIYWDVTNIKENDKYIKILKNKFNIVQEDVGLAPMLIYIKDGQAIEIYNSNRRLVDEKVLIDLLNKYGIV